jgi:hypothetical protein
LPRYTFPAATVTNTTGAPLRLTFHATSATGRRETDLWTLDSDGNLVERIPNGIIVTDSSGAYSAFAGPDDSDTLYRVAHNGSTRTAITATGIVAGNGGTYLDSAYAAANGQSSQGRQYLYYADHLRRWRGALADADIAQASIGFFGDSITAGAHSTNSTTSNTSQHALWRTQGYAGRVRSLFALRYGEVGEGFLPGNLNPALAPNSYMSVSSAIVGGPSPFGMANRTFHQGTGQTSTWTLPACTTIEIVYGWRQGTSGRFTYTVDGGGAATQPTQTVSGTYSETITGLANTTHTVVITGPASGFAEVVSIGAWTNTDTGVAVHRNGLSGLRIRSAWDMANPSPSLSAADQQSQVDSVTTGQRIDLAVIWLSANNSINTQTPAQVKTGFQAVCDRMVAQGLCVLLVGGPPISSLGSNYGTTYHQSDFDPLIKQVARDTDHVAWLDMGQFWQSYTYSTDLYQNDGVGVHPNRAGHGDVANLFYNVLSAPY